MKRSKYGKNLNKTAIANQELRSKTEMKIKWQKLKQNNTKQNELKRDKTEETVATCHWQVIVFGQRKDVNKKAENHKMGGRARNEQNEKRERDA